MGPLIHQILLALSITALAWAALRVASLFGRGLERLLAAAAIAAALAAAESLLLGLVALGTSPVALYLAAAATALAAWRTVPAPDRPVLEEALAAWRELAPPARIGLGALGGMWLAWCVWLVRFPALGFDSLTYHVPEVVNWIHNGRPGSIAPVFPGIEVGNFPLTNEVLVGWASGISRSFLPATLWAPPLLALLVVAAWSGLRSLDVPRLPAALAVAAIATPPLLTNYQENGTHTDLPALAWLVTAAALLVRARRHPPLLVPAVVAAGLAIGTKTTVLPLMLVALAIALWSLRGELRRLRRPLLAAAGLAGVAGGYWFLRNLVDHGSPFWPHVTTPWGDPVSADNNAPSFLDRPGDTVRKLGGDYIDLFAGGLVLLVGGLVAPLVARKREVTYAALTALVFSLTWAQAPKTGPANHDVTTVAVTRYLIPGVTVAVLALALTARAGGARRAFALAVLGAGVVLNVWQTFDLGFPKVPQVWTPLLGAALGALAAAALTALPGRLGPLPRPSGRPAALALTVRGAVAAGALATPASTGFIERHARTGLFDGQLALWFKTTRSDDLPAAMTPLLAAPVAGEQMERRVTLVPPRERCAKVAALRRDHWVVVAASPFPILGPSSARECLAAARPALDGGFRVYGPEAADSAAAARLAADRHHVERRVQVLRP